MMLFFKIIIIKDFSRLRKRVMIHNAYDRAIILTVLVGYLRFEEIQDAEYCMLQVMPGV